MFISRKLMNIECSCSCSFVHVHVSLMFMNIVMNISETPNPAELTSVLSGFVGLGSLLNAELGAPGCAFLFQACPADSTLPRSPRPLLTARMGSSSCLYRRKSVRPSLRALLVLLRPAGPQHGILEASAAPRRWDGELARLLCAALCFR